MWVQFLLGGCYTTFMTPEEKALLIKTAETVKENNTMLRKMRRGARLRAALHAFYWIAIIGLSFGAYYFVEPYIQDLLGVYQELRGNVDAAKDSIGDFGKLLQ